MPPAPFCRGAVRARACVRACVHARCVRAHAYMRLALLAFFVGGAVVFVLGGRFCRRRWRLLSGTVAFVLDGFFWE